MEQIKNKISVLKVFTFLCATLTFLYVCGAASAATIYVPDDYANIQWAVDNASAGDTIVVRDGVYVENIDISKPLTILSEGGPENCVVQAVDLHDHVFHVTADNVTIKGFTVTASSMAGFCLSYSNNCRIENVFASNNYNGIYLGWYSSNNTIANNTISSNNWDGIRLFHSSNNTIANNTISSNNWDGIRLFHSSNNTIASNTVSNNADGIFLDDSSSNTIANNTISSNNYNGIYLGWYSSNNTIASNTVSNNEFGIYWYSSNNNTIANNTFHLNGVFVRSSYDNTVTNNTVNGKPLVYLEGVSDYVVEDAGQVIAVNSNNITVENLNLSYATVGVEFWNTSNNKIINNTVSSNNDDGIYLYYSSNTTIANNTVSSNNDDGIYLESSSHNTIASNTVSNNDGGIYLDCSNHNTIAGNTVSNNDCGIGLLDEPSHNTIASNTISNNEFGIYWYSSNNNTIANNTFILDGMFVLSLHYSYNNTVTNNTVNGKPLVYLEGVSDYVVEDAGQVIAVNSNNITVENLNLSYATVGVEFWNTSNSKIINNTISNNEVGICLDESSNNNTIANNTVSNSDNGIFLYYSTNNTIYFNNFINQVYSYSSSRNIWNSTSKITYTYNGNTYTNYLGNYWDDYTGTDTNNDGIGDTPYSIDGDKDNYPLMERFENYFAPTEPYTKTDVGVTTNITLASPSDLVPYLPPEYADIDISDAVVFNVNVTDNTPDNLTDDAYTDITIKVGDMNVETCKVFKTGIGFLPEVDDITALPTVDGDPAFSRDLANKTVTVRLYVGDPLLGVIPPAAPSVFDTGPSENPYPSIMGTHKGEIKPSCNITVSKLYTYPCPGTGGHTESIELYENGELIANGTWKGYAGDWHNITIHNVSGAPYVRLLKGHKYNYTIVTGSYPQIIHRKEFNATGGEITCTEFVDANGKVYYDWIPAIKLS